jgi:hypothetical protein
MAFDWWCPKRNDSFEKRLAGRFEEALRREVSDRAFLLARLGWPRDAALKRIQERVRWDFEMSRVPPALWKDIPSLVDQAFPKAGK